MSLILNSFKRRLRAVINRYRVSRPLKAQQNEINAVLDFFTGYEDFRSLSACARYTGLDMNLCGQIKHHLYRERKLGLYYFEADVPPQKYMREHILKKFPMVTRDSFILEVGPGEYPVFPIPNFQNWFGVDKYFQDGVINFKEQLWAKDKYPKERLIKGGWENLSEIFKSTKLTGMFDLVVGSHSYEHVFRPIQSLVEANKMLRPGGILVLFVPDGLTDDINTKDPTHTLYLVPEMIEEFFYYAGGYTDLSIERFRPNVDLVITAIKQ